MRQTRRATRTTVTTQAASIDSAVRRPSKRSVTRNSGIRSNDGPGGL